MAKRDLINLVLSQLADVRQPDLFSYPSLSRRAFLLGVGLVAPATPALSLGLTPRYRRVGRGMEISFGAERWLLDPGAFAESASLATAFNGPDITLILDRARLAGTDLRLDLHARIFEARSGWRIALDIPQLELRGQLALMDWLRGEPVTGRMPVERVRLGSGRLSLSGADASISTKSGLSLAIRAKQQPLRLTGRAACSAAGLLLEPHCLQQTAGHSLTRVIGQASGVAASTRLHVVEPRLQQPLGLSLPGVKTRPRCRLDIVERLSGELFDSATGPAEAIMVEGVGEFSHACANSGARQRLAFDRAALLIASGKAGLAAELSGGQSVDISGLRTRLAGESPGTLTGYFDRGALSDVSGALRVDEIWLPAIGGVAALNLSGAQVTLPVGGRGNAIDPASTVVDGIGSLANEIPPAPAPQKAAEDSLRQPPGQDYPSTNTRSRQVIGTMSGSTRFYSKDPDLSIPLNNVVLSVRRPIDMLNLSFRFEGFEFRTNTGLPGGDGVPHVRHVAGKEHRIIVEFPPQHLWETVHEKPDKCGPTDWLSQARLSAPSRLAFDASHESWSTRALTFDKLLDWSDLEPLVDGRAAARLADDLPEQLTFLQIDKQTPLDIAMDKIAGTFRPPSLDSTALELAARLIFSPSEYAGWEKQKAGTARGTPIWNIRLDSVGRQSVRALWSSYFTSGHLPRPGEMSNKPDGAASTPPPLALRPKQHWEIVAQTSVYGLPALRRMVPKENASSSTADALRKTPRGDVLRPTNAEYAYLTDVDRIEQAQNPYHKDRDSGVAMPRPFDDADISLSGLGAIMRARWEGEPPHYLPADDILGVSLEQLIYNTWLGRDIRVIAVTKGYLFPLGIRASFVELSERRFYPDPSGNPVSIEVKRYFIRVRPTPKRFPAFNQPFGSRDFPAASVTMRSLVTPDLVNPADQPDPARGDWSGNGKQMPPAAELFWPRVRGRDRKIRDFQFQWATDSAEGVTSPLLFVASEHVAVQDIMKTLVAYYRDKVPYARRTARFNGARQRYAAEKTDGEASFDTDNWLLNARGLLFGKEGEESFAFDARMNGADQPPFYPFVDKAQISIQSLDRMIGSPQGLVSVDFHDPYRRLGFDDPGQQKSEIYLRVLEPPIAFDVQRDSRRSGGVASPSTLVAALSRKIGIVGGTARTSVDNAALQPLRALAAGTVETEQGFTFDQAALGNFDLKEFFGFKLPTLLGVIDLNDVIKGALVLSDAPRLAEKVTYGALEEGFGHLKRAADDAQKAADDFFRDFDTIRRQVDGALGDKLKFENLYPELARQVANARSEIPGKLGKIARAASPEDVLDDVPGLMAAARPLIQAIVEVVRDPVPEAAGAIITEFHAYWQDVLKALKDGPKNIEAAMRDLVAGALKDALCRELEGLGPAMFGTAPGTTCDDFVRDPANTLSNTAQSLFADTLALPLARLFAYLSDLRVAIIGKFDFARSAAAAIEDKAASLLVQATDAIAPYLAAYDQTKRDIRDTAVQLETARQITVALAAKLRRDFASADIGAIGAAFRDDLKEVIETESLRLLDTIYPNLEVDGTGRPRVINPATGNPYTARELLELVNQRLVEPVRQAADKYVQGEIKRVQDLVNAQAAALPITLLKQVTELLTRSVDALLATAEFAQVAQAAQQAAGACATVANAAKAIGSRLGADTAQLTLSIDSIVDALTALKFEVGDATQNARLEALRSTTLGLLRKLRTEIASVDVARANLERLGAGCADVQSALDPVRLVLESRRRAVALLDTIAATLVDIQHVLDKPPLQSANLNDDLRNIARDLATLLRDVTTIAKYKDADATIVRVRALANGLPVDLAHRKKLIDFLDAMARGAKDLRDFTVNEVDDLRRLSNAAIAYAETFERNFASMVLQMAAISGEANTRWEEGAARAINAAAVPVSSLHHALTNLFVRLRDLLEGDAEPVMIFVMGQATFARLKEAIAAIVREDTLLQVLAQPRPALTTLSDARKLYNQWRQTGQQDPPDAGGPAIFNAIDVVSNFIEKFLAGNLGSDITLGIRRLLERYVNSLREFLSGLIPTKIETGYDWSTAIQPFGPFSMSNISTNNDLKLTARASMNLITGVRDVSMKGELQSFQLKLIGSLDMATIRFKPMTFVSRNGSEPHFDVAVEHVEIGGMLKFLDALKAYMSPQDNGFYIVPLAWPGIEAGFQFSVSPIRVGSVTFTNVALRVAARLPFVDRPAEFVFQFANEDRPFMISSPPYGGAGYAELTVLPGGNYPPRLAVVFMFGGAADLTFGPLRAVARVMVGFGARTMGDGTTLIAVFEAVGEGSIACFSISVCLRVTAWHYPSGNMVGQATYSFKFKVGLFSYTYSVTATYRAKGSGGNAPAALMAGRTPAGAAIELMAGLAGVGEHSATHSVRVPFKVNNWAEYRHHIDHSLLR